MIAPILRGFSKNALPWRDNRYFGICTFVIVDVYEYRIQSLNLEDVNTLHDTKCTYFSHFPCLLIVSNIANGDVDDILLNESIWILR